MLLVFVIQPASVFHYCRKRTRDQVIVASLPLNSCETSRSAFTCLRVLCFCICIMGAPNHSTLKCRLQHGCFMSTQFAQNLPHCIVVVLHFSLIWPLSFECLWLAEPYAELCIEEKLQMWSLPSGSLHFHTRERIGIRNGTSSETMRVARRMDSVNS